MQSNTQHKSAAAANKERTPTQEDKLGHAHTNSHTKTSYISVNTVN